MHKNSERSQNFQLPATKCFHVVNCVTGFIDVRENLEQLGKTERETVKSGKFGEF